MTTATDLLGLVERATLAPSPHNVQPWRWRVGDDTLELAVDPARALPVGDPSGREAVMACGAALLTFRVAAARAHVGVDVDVLAGGDAADGGPLARIRLAAHAVDVEFAALDAAVPVRRAWRGPLRAGPVPPALLARLVAEAHVEGARLVEVGATGRDAVARLVAAADAAPVRAAPAVVVLATADDGPAAWLAAGQALQRVLLVADAHGLAVGFVNSACEDTGRRAALRDVLGGAHPQAVLRLGRRPRAARLVRRRAAERSAGRALHRRLPVREVADVVGGTPPGQRKSTSPVSTS